MQVTAESVSALVAFDAVLAARLADRIGAGDPARPSAGSAGSAGMGRAPLLPTGAGHDAGVLAAHRADRDAVRAQPDRVCRTPRPSPPRTTTARPGYAPWPDVLEELLLSR